MSSWSSRDAALCMGWALIEALAIAATAVAVTATLPAGAPRLAPAPLVALMVASALVGHAGARARLRAPLGRLLALPLGALLAAAWARLAAGAGADGVTTTSLGLLALLVAGRGLLIGAEPPTQPALMRALLRGVVLLMLLFGLLSLAQVELTPALRTQLRTLVLGYFAAGPAVVALAQRRDLGRARGVRAAASASWLLAIAVPVVSALALALLASHGAGGLREGVHLAGRALHVASALTAQALASVAYGGLLALSWLARLLPGGGTRDAPPPSPPPGAPSDDPMVAVGPAPVLPVVQHDVAAGVLLVTAVLFVTLYVSRLLRAPTDSDDPFGADEERASLWSWQLLARQARDLLRAILVRAKGLGSDARPHAAWPSAHAAADLSDVRGVYRALLRWVDARGRTRTPTTTPHELAARLPCSEEQRHHLEVITDIYAETRYGEREPTQARLVDARAHLSALTTTEPPAPDAASEVSRTRERR